MMHAFLNYGKETNAELTLHEDAVSGIGIQSTSIWVSVTFQAHICHPQLIACARRLPVHLCAHITHLWITKSQDAYRYCSSRLCIL